MELSKEFLNDLFEYRDGELFYKVTRGRNKAGSKAGTYRYHDNAYQVIINKKHYLMHRIVYMMHNGYMPKFVDHKDGNRSNNQIENLREATHSENACNAKVRSDSKTKLKNISWNNTNKSWKVRVQANNCRMYLGQFQDLELAELVAIMAREKYHGAFANHGIKGITP
jgi:hypothetical protein